MLSICLCVKRQAIDSLSQSSHWYGNTKQQ